MSEKPILFFGLCFLLFDRFVVGFFNVNFPIKSGGPIGISPFIVFLSVFCH
jgi:hypothetical protein